METIKRDFTEQINKGLIEVINSDRLVIEDYPYGFKKCKMTFQKAQNRNGQIIQRFSEINGKISKPKKTTSCRLNIFVFDKELKRHFILSLTHHLDISIYTTSLFCSNEIYTEYYYSLTDRENKTILDFLKPYLNITEEVYNKILEYKE